MTQLELAEEVGVSSKYIGRLEQGVSVPSFRLLVSLSILFDVDPATLLLPIKRRKARAGRPKKLE